MSRRISSAALGVCVSCGPQGPPVPDRVEPGRGFSDRDTPIAIVGTDLGPTLADRGNGGAILPWEIALAGRPLRDIVVVSAERLDAVVPPGLPSGTHDLTLRSGSRETRLAGAFRSVAPLPPRLDVVNPDELGPMGGPVVLHGVGLYPESSVAIDGRPVSVTWLDDETLRVVAPPGADGPAPLEVRTPVGRAMRADLLSYRSDR